MFFNQGLYADHLLLKLVAIGSRSCLSQGTTWHHGQDMAQLQWACMTCQKVLWPE